MFDINVCVLCDQLVPSPSRACGYYAYASSNNEQLVLANGASAHQKMAKHAQYKSNFSQTSC